MTDQEIVAGAVNPVMIRVWLNFPVASISTTRETVYGGAGGVAPVTTCGDEYCIALRSTFINVTEVVVVAASESGARAISAQRIGQTGLDRRRNRVGDFAVKPRDRVGIGSRRGGPVVA